MRGLQCAHTHTHTHTHTAVFCYIRAEALYEVIVLTINRERVTAKAYTRAQTNTLTWLKSKINK